LGVAISKDSTMLDILDRKVRQMHAALAALGTGDLSHVEPEVIRSETYTAVSFDFGADADPIELANAASLLVANIASLKDHLKVWCGSKGIAFNGDRLISTNRSTALIHDLWNVDKHAKLTSSPRSGHVPKLHDLRQSLRLSTGTQPGSSVFMTTDPRTGKLVIGGSGGGGAKLTLTATIVDESGNALGDFGATCAEAVAAWGTELRNAGVPLP
jgi:hypothetical protein